MSKKDNKEEPHNEALADTGGPIDETPINEATPVSDQDLQTQFDQLNDKYLRLYSDFENFRRVKAKERIDLIRSAGEDVMRLLLPVLDDFQLALGNMEAAVDVKSIKEGVDLIYQKLLRELAGQGLRVMESIGKDFDTDFHEAVAQIPAPHKKQKGKVIDVVQEGYFLGDKVIRCAKVVVGA